MRTSQAVKLHRVRAAHQPEQEAVPAGPGRRQVAIPDEHALACPAAHQDDPQPGFGAHARKADNGQSASDTSAAALITPVT
jgi:hypothetical protein